MKTHNIDVSRNVVFYDDWFPQSHILHGTTTFPQSYIPLPFDHHADFIDNLPREENVVNEIIDTEKQDEPLNVSHSSTRRSTKIVILSTYYKIIKGLYILHIINKIRYPIVSFISLARLSYFSTSDLIYR